MKPSHAVGSMLCLAASLLVLGCTSSPSPGMKAAWTTDMDGRISICLVPSLEIARRFGPGPEENPFIARRGLFTGGLYFSVIVLANKGPEVMRIEDIRCIDVAGSELGSAMGPRDLRRYWSSFTAYGETLDSKMEIVRREYLGDEGLLQAGAVKLVAIASEKVISPPFAIVLELADGSSVMFDLAERLGGE